MTSYYPKGASGTLTAELNRLANFGVYPNPQDYLAAQGAANAIAGTSGLGIIAALNYVADPNRQPRDYKDLNGICNELAGTTGLSAVAALSQIGNISEYWLTSQASYYIDATDASASTQTVTNLGAAGSLLPTTVGSSTAADSNDPKFLDHTGTNYVYLPGVTSNLLSVPDANNLDITGDIDLRWYGSMDDWTPSATQNLISKWLDASPNNSWYMSIRVAAGSFVTGSVLFQWVDSAGVTQSANSSVAVPFTDGTAGWVRLTLDVDNGAGGNTVTFFTSTDGITWTTLGTPVTQAFTTNIRTGTSSITIGNRSGDQFLAAKIYRAQILDGIDGTKVLDVDTSVITAGSATSFTAVTGQTVTINRSTSGRKTVAVTQPTWLFGTDDYMEVNNRYMSSGTYLYLPGISLNAATTPDAAALDITGDIDLRCKVALDDWTPAALGQFISKYGASGNRSYQFYVITDGKLEFVWTADGSTINVAQSSVAPTVADGATLWVRVTLDVDNGASGNDVKFYTSDDGITWTQLGTTITNAGTTSIYNSTTQLAVGANSQTSLTQTLRGKFFRAQVLDGIDGTVAFDANFETSITSLLQTSFTESSANAATVTINRSGSTFRSAGITGTAGYLYPGATNTFTASATDFLNHGLNSFSYGLVLRQWITPTSNARLMFKGAIGATRYSISNNATTLALTATINDGTTNETKTSTALTAGTLLTNINVVNRSNSTFTNYTNSVANSGATVVGSVDNPFTFILGQGSGGASAYGDMELVAAYVFRSALTAAQVRQITNYFANREGLL